MNNDYELNKLNLPTAIFSTEKQQSNFTILESNYASNQLSSAMEEHNCFCTEGK